MVMSVKEKMTAIAEAIRTITLKGDALGLDGMITDLASVTEYSLADIEGRLPNMTLDEKLTALADVVRYGAAFEKRLSLDDMALIIAELRHAVASNGRDLFDTVDAAIAACEEGGTVTLLKDIDVGEMSDVLIEKDITLDGNGHTLTREVEGGHLFVIKKSGVVLNVKNLKCEFCASVDKAFIHANALSANLNIENCELNSNEVVVYFRNVDGDTSIKNSTVKSKEQVFQFNYTTGTIEILNSSLHGNSSTDATLHLYDSRSSVSIEASRMIGSYAPAISIRYSNAPVTISDSHIQAGYTNLGAIDIHNCSPTIDLKGTTQILIDENTHASIRMRGSQNCDPIITLYDNATLTDGVRSHIYYTTYAYRTGFHVKFADGYTGAKYKVLSTTDSDLNCQVWLENTLTNAFSRVGTVCAFDTTEAMALGYTVNYDSALECYVIEHNGTHFTWQDSDLSVTPSIKRSGWNLTANCAANITNREYANTEKITYSYAWYRSGVLLGSDKSIEVGDSGTYEVVVTVYATLTDSSGCVSLISASASVSIKI
jgi:hypothetical protein